VKDKQKKRQTAIDSTDTPIYTETTA